MTVHALNELNKTVLIPASQLPTTTGLTKEDKSRAFKGCKKVEFYVFAVTQSALSQGDAWHAWVDKTVALLSQKGRDWVREDEEIKQITITGKVGNQKRRLVEEIP